VIEEASHDGKYTSDLIVMVTAEIEAALGNQIVRAMIPSPTRSAWAMPGKSEKGLVVVQMCSPHREFVDRRLVQVRILLKYLERSDTLTIFVKHWHAHMDYSRGIKKVWKEQGEERMPSTCISENYQKSLMLN